MKHLPCHGRVLTGYWKGKPCGASATTNVEDKDYCLAHYHVAIVEPERFEKARQSWERNRSPKS